MRLGAGARGAPRRETQPARGRRHVLLRAPARGGEMGRRGAAARGVFRGGSGTRGNIDRKPARDIVPLRAMTGQIKGRANQRGRSATPIHPRIQLDLSSVLSVLDAPTRQLVQQQLTTMTLFQKHPVALVAPYAIRVK
jgi:hypothetical protein